MEDMGTDSATTSEIPKLTLEEHERRSNRRFKKLRKEVKTMAGGAREDLNVIGGGGGYDGFGSGGLGIIALLALLSNRNGFGFGGNTDGAGVVALQSSIDTNAILQGIGDIKAAVPLAEAQVQLALAGAQADITSQSLQQTIALQNQGFTAQLDNLQGFANTKDAVDSLSTQVAVGQGVTNTNIERLGWSLSREISTDGEKTRALIGSIDRDNLNRIITTQAAELAELRNEGNRDRDRLGIEISMINNQNQNQMQFQQQAQVLGTLSHALLEVGQIARATNQNLIVGNTGATTTGAQTANPVNVKA